MGRNPQPILQVVGGFICLAVGKPVTSLPLAWTVANLRIFLSVCPAAWFSLLKQVSRTDFFVLSLLCCGDLVQILNKKKKKKQYTKCSSCWTFYYRDDTYATARISNGSRHAVQHARHDGNELWLSDSSWTHGHAGVYPWDVSWNETFLLLWFYILTAKVARCVVFHEPLVSWYTLWWWPIRWILYLFVTQVLKLVELRLSASSNL